MTSADDVIATASREVGYHEGPNNDNKYGRWYGMNNVAWCYIFCQWVFAQTGRPLPFRTAYVPAGADWARRSGAWRPSTQCAQGDLIVFDFTGSGRADTARTHIGIVASRNGSMIHTIEGNMSDMVGHRQWTAGGSLIAGTINCQSLFSGAPQTHPAPTGNRFQAFPTLSEGAQDNGVAGMFPDLEHPVATLQNALNIVNHKEGGIPGRLTADGSFGPMTADAVRVFQSFVHASNPEMAVDGMVGPRTWEALDFFLDHLGR